MLIYHTNDYIIVSCVYVRHCLIIGMMKHICNIRTFGSTSFQDFMNENALQLIIFIKNVA